MTACRLRWGVALVLVAAVVAACSSSAGSPGHSPSDGRGIATAAGLAMPPSFPCRYPTAAELAELGTASSAVVEATVSAATVTPPGGDNGNTYTWTYPLQDLVVLLGRPGVAAPTSISEVGSASMGLLAPGKYILFLTNAGPDYYVAGGMEGAFPVTTAGTVERFCVNYQDPASPVPAQGTPPSEAAFRGLLPTVLALPPTRP